MAYRYSPNHALLNESAQILGASVTAAVSKEFRISHAGSLNLLVGIKCSGLTAGAGISAKLQSSFYGQVQADWIDGNSVSLTGNGWFYIRMNVQTAADQAKLPLGDVARLVVTTGAGSAVTISDVLVLQGL